MAATAGLTVFRISQHAKSKCKNMGRCPEIMPLADPESSVRGGPTLTSFFCSFFFVILVDEGS